MAPRFMFGYTNYPDGTQGPVRYTEAEMAEDLQAWPARPGENIYANPLTPRALEIAKERDPRGAENAALRAALEQAVVALQFWPHGDPTSTLAQCRRALAATAPAAPGDGPSAPPPAGAGG